jgi:hypothetical protein
MSLEILADSHLGYKTEQMEENKKKHQKFYQTGFYL